MAFKTKFLFSMMLGCHAFATPPSLDHTSIKFPTTNKNYKILQSRAKTLQHLPQTIIANTNPLPTEKQLGMNNVPVLDQGNTPYESIFASTAAIDAALGKGDFISQLCLIKLGNYMNSSNKNSGFALRHSLSRLENYGYIMKRHQKGAGCDDPSQPFINYESYNKLSRYLLRESVVWFPILDMYKSLNGSVNTKKTLIEVQKAISQEQRVTMSFLAFQTDASPLGATGTHHVMNDTWLLNTKMKRELYNFPALYFHSVVITGYNNDAITVDDEGTKHKGLLTLRGSWGNNAGDQGDFYMTYDYFQVLVIEAQQIAQMLSD